jgi:nucleolar MIF4G domain-containing protein 1
MVSILQSLEELYSKNARQHITSTVVDLLVGLVADPSILNDSFLILHAGFTAAVYKVVGTDFGAQVLEQLVEKFDAFRSSSAQEDKQALNVIAFLCNLYTFQVVGSAIIFDYIRLLLDELSETNTELLLRVIRTCGQSLRQDDPSALKDIILLLQRSVAKLGEANVSVRTKFMIETIHDLKNNRMKAATSSTLSTEQTNRIKKALSSLNHTRSIRSAEPLQITLADIRDSDKKGKWWLVGASYHDPSKLANNTTSASTKRPDVDEDAGYESETPGKPNLRKLAREHGMNTEVRRAIFIALLSSVDCYDAHMRLLKLHLKNKQMLEIPRVLVHCAGAEATYNPFYTLVAKKFCGEHHKRKAFEFAVRDFFRQMSGLDDEEEEASVTKIVNLAKFNGTLVADGSLNLRILKKLEYPYLGTKAGMFVEVFLTTIFIQSRKTHKVEPAFEKSIQGVFMPAAGNVDMIQGMREVIEAHVSKAELANGKKEQRAVEMGCRVALETLDVAAKAVPIPENDEEEDDDEL